MGKAGRIACIALPMAMSLLALTLLALVGLGQSNGSNQFLSDIYFLRANLTGATGQQELFNNAPTNQTPSVDIENGKIVIHNFYSIGLWNYCAGGGVVSNNTSPEASDPSAHVDFCTAREAQFAFNPELVWGLPSTFTTRFFSSDLSHWLDEYENVIGKALGPLFILTIGMTALSVLVGLAAVFSRIGSLCTTIAMLISTALDFVFSLMATIAFFSIEVAFNKALSDQDISFHHDPKPYIFMWLSVAVLLVSTLFWGFSSCCVSGRSSRRERSDKGMYQRMDHSPAPQFAQQSVPLTTYGGPSAGAYEPYRHA